MSEVRRPIAYDSIRCRMSLIKSIFGELYHFIKNFVCFFGRNTVSDCALYRYVAVFVLNAVYEVYSFLFHYVVLLFCHSTAHKVASAVRISRNIAYYLHYLLLVYHTAVRYIENRFKAFIRIFYVIRIAPVFKIPRYLIHRTRAVKRNSCNYIFYIYRLQFLEE